MAQPLSLIQHLSLFQHVSMAPSSRKRPQLLGGDGLETTWSLAAWEGRRAEDRVVALRRPWPSDADGPGLEPPLSIEQTSTVSSGPGASTVAAAANLLGRGLAAAVTGSSSLLRGSNASSSGGGGGSGSGSGGTPRAGAPAAGARPSYQLFAAFDGHNGAEAARFAEHSIVPILEIFLPSWSTLALFPAEPAELAAQLQQALALSFLELHRQFAMAGCLGGCTATVVLQVGRLVTVASVGSSRCLLFTGAPSEAPMALSEEHRIHTHLRERQRLLATGRQVAAVDVSGSGPAPTPVRGSGVLRLWPGGLTLSRSIGDFNIGQAVLPLPHIKQVLLPRTGGRLVLATDGVWSQAAGRALTAMAMAPLKTVAHEVVKSLGGSSADASIIVADVLPPKTSFQEVCKRQEALAAKAAPAGGAGIAGIGKGAGQAMMRVLKLGRSKSTPSMQQQEAAAADASQSAAAKLLMDVDTAELLGLMPPAPGSPTRSGSFGSAGSAGSAGGGAGGSPGAPQRQPLVPLWFDEQLGHQMQASLVESYQLWHLARRRIKAVEVAALCEADLLERRTSRSETDLTWLEAAAEQAVAAADAELVRHHGAAGAAGGEAPFQSPFAPAPGSPLAPADAAAPGFRLSADAPLVLRSNSLAAPPGSPAAAAAAAGASRPGLQKQRSLPASPFASLPPSPYSALPPSPYASHPSPVAAAAAAAAPQRRVARSDSARAADDAASVVSEETVASLGGSSVRRVSFGDPAGSVDPLASPRLRLPPLRKQVSLPPSRGGIPRSPASTSSGQACATPVEPSTGRSVARSISASASARPPLPRSALLGAAAGSSSSRTVAPGTPRLEDLEELQALPRRRRAPGELVGSPETRWRTAYNLSAGMFTKAGSGYSRRNLLPAEGMDSWVESQCGVAEQFLGRPRSRAASVGSLDY